MLVLLPPSEGKAAGGAGAPLDLARLSHPALNPVRARLVDALVEAATSDPAALQAALGCPDGEVDKDAALLRSPTLPALRRYTGVVYEALSYAKLSPAGRRRANGSLRVASALFGLLAPRDPIPAYRLSGSTSLPGVGSLAALWRPVLEPELAPARVVVDLRSGPYAALARVPHAVSVRVLRERGGKRTVVSHDNKTRRACSPGSCASAAPGRWPTSLKPGERSPTSSRSTGARSTWCCSVWRAPGGADALAACAGRRTSAHKAGR